MAERAFHKVRCVILALYYDNKVATSIAHNAVQHDRRKHIEVDCHFIKEQLQHGWIFTPFVKTGDQLADVKWTAVP